MFCEWGCLKPDLGGSYSPQVFFRPQTRGKQVGGWMGRRLGETDWENFRAVTRSL